MKTIYPFLKRRPKVLFLGLLLFLLVSCQSIFGPAVNGTYTGGLYDSIYGYLGAFGIDVTTSGSSVSGAACFVSVGTDPACNSLRGTLSGTNFRFTVGAISFNTTVSGDTISGSYSFSEGSGTINLSKSSSRQLPQPQTTFVPLHLKPFLAAFRQN